MPATQFLNAHDYLSWVAGQILLTDAPARRTNATETAHRITVPWETALGWFGACPDPRSVSFGEYGSLDEVLDIMSVAPEGTAVLVSLDTSTTTTPATPVSLSILALRLPPGTELPSRWVSLGAWWDTPQELVFHAERDMGCDEAGDPIEGWTTP
jgi:hypothetical protein